MAEEMKTVNAPLKAVEEVKKEKTVEFSASFVQSEQLSAESAVAAVSKYLAGFKNLNERFLALVGKAGATQTEKLYFPIYRMEGKAEYLWVTGSGEHAVPHKELRLVKTETHSLPKGLALRVAGEEKPLRDGEKLAYKEGGKKLSVKDCAKLLRAEAERTVPEKRSKITFTEENFVVSYLPVLKVLIVFEGKTYSAFVNLVNGDCVAEYAVSEKLTAAVAKTINTVKNRRSFIFVTFLYTLAFAVMGFVKFFEGSLSGVVTPALLAGLAVVLLLFWGQCFAYKKEKLLNKGIETGKMPKAKCALFLSVLSAVIAVAAIVLFALQIL